MKITDVQPDSLADQYGIRIDDDLHRINFKPVRDIIDYHFLISDEVVELEIIRKNSKQKISIEKEPDQTLGIQLEEIKPRSCGNRCVFCFIDQNPQGLRKSLYVKDEDFRFSFLYGNYVTLTNISLRDLQRIVKQRLSPLYVSIHATDQNIRKRLLGLKKDDRLVEKLDFLTRHGIELHTQIVLCPGINDAAVLDQTIEELEDFYPQLASVAIVPVGLTKHRANLPELQPVSQSLATELISRASERALRYFKRWGRHWLFLADEFYLLANTPVPAGEWYDDFTQIENGVGMTRELLDNFEIQQRDFPEKLPEPKSIAIATGVSAYPFMEEIIVARLNKISNLNTKIFSIKNDFYGEKVTVSGLLTGEDIFRALQNQETGDILFLPQNCVNYDDLFLDNWSIDKLSNLLETPVQLINNDFIEIFEEL